MADFAKEKEALACKVVELAKALALADNPFLSSAVGRLKLECGRYATAFATDGAKLGINADIVCARFLEEDEPPMLDFLHSLLHCIFLHPYVDPSVDRALWNLACDIAVERLIAEITDGRGGPRGLAIERAISCVQADVDRRLSAELIYRALCEGAWINQRDEWAELFVSDDHYLWYPVALPTSQSDDDSVGAGGDGGEGDTDDASTKKPKPSESSPDSQTEDVSLPQPQEQQAEEQVDLVEEETILIGALDEEADDQQEYGFSSGSDSGFVTQNYAADEISRTLHEVAHSNRDLEEREWRRIAKGLAVNLQTYAKKRGEQLLGFVEDLEEASRQKADYEDFLLQFAIPGEDMRLSDDEFDYVFYTYGMDLYGNMPLIEPLEYREDKLIRNFVIVIDTSGSVQGPVVRGFIQATFDILKQTEVFHESICLHIIQCDYEVRSDDKIETLDELQAWSDKMEVYGGGGTDFRPAFDYVDALLDQGELTGLDGLIYFTDGWGTYPDWMPEYRCAFVFYDDHYRPEVVPTWAAQIVLDRYEIEAHRGEMR